MNIRHLPARKAVVGLSLVACGLIGGATIAAAGTANAADPTPSSTANTSPGGGAGETALTGDTLTKVKAAVTAKYPGATFDHVTTDNDGAYEADITTATGTKLTVEVSKTFAVTGTETHTGRGGHHGGGAGETALTGDTLTKVKAAVTAKYPGATFDHVTTDNDGAYEADITTATGTKLTVEVNKTFAVTGTETHTGR